MNELIPCWVTSLKFFKDVCENDSSNVETMLLGNTRFQISTGILDMGRYRFCLSRYKIKNF